MFEIVFEIAGANSEKWLVYILRQLNRAETFSGTIRGVRFTFGFTFRFGITSFSGQFRSAEVPP